MSPISRDFVEFHKTLANELSANKDRVRNLIGGKHWLSDGEHKEAVLRHILQTRLPQSVSIGNGFVCFLDSNNKIKSSNQIDILITSNSSSFLYQNGEFFIVTADGVKAIIEVKTKRKVSEFKKDCKKVSDNIEMIRNTIGKEFKCWAGLFIYENEISNKNILDAIQESAEGKESRVINCVSIGNNKFVKFWENKNKIHNEDVDGCVWNLYEIENLAPAYFISNLTVHLNPDIPRPLRVSYFPIEKGKKSYRVDYRPLKAVKE